MEMEHVCNNFLQSLKCAKFQHIGTFVKIFVTATKSEAWDIYKSEMSSQHI